jgi:hypothetical protein
MTVRITATIKTAIIVRIRFLLGEALVHIAILKSIT